MAIDQRDAEGLHMIKALLIGSDLGIEQELLAQQSMIQPIYSDLQDMDAILQLVAKEQPHIIIIYDQDSPSTADELCLLINLAKNNDSKVMIVTDATPDLLRLRASGFKCRGYIASEQRNKIDKAIRVVYQGEAWLPRKLVADLLDHLANDTTAILPLLRLVK